MERFTQNGRTWYEKDGQAFTAEIVRMDAHHDEEINPALSIAVHKFLAREELRKIEIVATTRGAVSHCDVSVQDEPMWEVRAYFPMDERVLVQSTPGLFSKD